MGFTNPIGTGGVLDMCMGCGGVGGGVGGMIQGLGGWGGVMHVCVVSLDSLWRWQVQVSACCARQIPANLWCTRCSCL